MNTTLALHTKNLSFFFIAAFICVGVNTLSARAEKSRCFVDICIDSSSVELSKSDIPGAPSYPVRTILVSQQFSNDKLLAQMEVDCQQRQLRTVRVSQDGENWSNFSPKWTLVDGHSSLSRLVDYTCKLAIAEQENK
ncbi:MULTISPECIES: hypothetical protein [unclassified Microcoleus]|uniref:hypothetical protein n=1 Tax=unclassified Microcoleus TaxID=2642155 RepID=UPI002FD188BA